MVQAVKALDALFRAVTKRSGGSFDEELSSSSSSTSSVSSASRRGRESLELDFHGGTLNAMEDVTQVRDMVLLLAQDNQDLKITLNALQVIFLIFFCNKNWNHI